MKSLNFVFVCSALNLVACGQNLDSTAGGESQPKILNGVVDEKYRSVGLLNVGFQSCTATLIGEKTILTAAHCVHYPDELRSSSFWLYGEDEVLPTTYQPLKVHSHPGYVHKPGVPDQVGLFDVSVIELDRPVTGFAPSTISAVAPTVSQQITLVGFGQIGDGQSDPDGNRRRVDNTVAVVNPMTFAYKGKKNIWHGDSGGPTFSMVDGEEVLIGNHSGGELEKFGMDMRLDYFCSWLKQVTAGDIKLNGECPAYSPQDGGLSDAEGSAASLPQN